MLLNVTNCRIRDNNECVWACRKQHGMNETFIEHRMNSLCARLESTSLHTITNSRIFTRASQSFVAVCSKSVWINSQLIFTDFIKCARSRRCSCLSSKLAQDDGLFLCSCASVVFVARTHRITSDFFCKAQISINRFRHSIYFNKFSLFSLNHWCIQLFSVPKSNLFIYVLLGTHHNIHVWIGIHSFLQFTTNRTITQNDL